MLEAEEKTQVISSIWFFLEEAIDYVECKERIIYCAAQKILKLLKDQDFILADREGKSLSDIALLEIIEGSLLNQIH